MRSESKLRSRLREHQKAQAESEFGRMLSNSAMLGSTANWLAIMSGEDDTKEHFIKEELRPVFLEHQAILDTTPFVWLFDLDMSPYAAFTEDGPFIGMPLGFEQLFHFPLALCGLYITRKVRGDMKTCVAIKDALAESIALASGLVAADRSAMLFYPTVSRDAYNDLIDPNPGCESFPFVARMFFILHELSHIVLGHGAQAKVPVSATNREAHLSRSRAHEFEADLFAWNHMCRLSRPPAEVSASAVISLFMLISDACRQAGIDLRDSTHPTPTERIESLCGSDTSFSEQVRDFCVNDLFYWQRPWAIPSLESVLAKHADDFSVDFDSFEYRVPKVRRTVPVQRSLTPRHNAEQE